MRRRGARKGSRLFRILTGTLARLGGIRRRLGGLRQGLLQYLDCPADAQQGLFEVPLPRFQIRQHFLAGLKFGFELVEALLQLFFHHILSPGLTQGGLIF